MKVKINEKLICIPPYISAMWDQVRFLQTEEDSDTKQMVLVIHLIDGKYVKIPGLDPSLIDIAFSAHMRHLEAPNQRPSSNSNKEESPPKALIGLLQQLTGLSPDQLSNMPIRLGLPGGIENIEMAFQHNTAQSHSPDMPQEVIDKIVSMAKLMGNNDLGGFPKPEPHCNCMHCQVARAIHGLEKNDTENASEEIIEDTDLSFRTWDIAQNGDKFYSVSNPLDPKEKYSVYLGTPVGCTCGEANCEHIKAVLYS